MLDELSAATGNDQLYGCRIIFIAAQYGKEFLHIGRSNITNTGKVSCVDLGGAGTQNLFHGMVTDFGAELTQDGFLGANHTLIDTDFFSPATAFLRLGILQIQKDSWFHCQCPQAGVLPQRYPTAELRLHTLGDKPYIL